MNYIFYIFVVTLIFLIYVEFSVGGIVYRVDASGLKKLQLGNIIYYLLNPLHDKFLWNLRLLDVNYIFVFLLASIVYKLKF